MCGIAGIYNRHKNIIDKDLLINMTESITHRGPDEDGYFFYNNIGISHKRLSIIDLENGVQPMVSENDNFIISFNGEIYNYLELKEKLVSHGYSFKSNSDTEVLLIAYQCWGNKVFDMLNGEWAIAIFDKAKNQLLLSRDRYGIKPLYYSLVNENFYFSSELKSFNENFDVELDKQELWDFFVFGPKDGGNTIFKNINELRPGKLLTLNCNDFTIKSYYSLLESFNINNSKLDLDNIENLLLDSINKRLMSDVPLATINSGGIDSSLISSIAINNIDSDLYTFSVAPNKTGEKTLKGDESYFAEHLAKKIKSKHFTIRYSKKNFVDEIESCMIYNDDILFHSNSIPLSYMYEKIKKDYNITVVLGGEGADEVFRGYSINRIANLYSIFDKPILKYIAIKILKIKYPRLNLVSKYFKDSSFYLQLAIEQNMHMSPKLANKLLGINGLPSKDRIALITRASKLSKRNQLVYYEQKCYLSGLLQRADRMSMRWGIEARVPFLDHRIVNYMNSINNKKKSGVKEKKLKKILKHISKKYIDSLIINRPKYGFTSPLDEYKKDIFDKYSKHNKDTQSLNDLTSQEILLIYNYQLLNLSKSKCKK
ncbi:MAG: asparagine synthase (glutamine-hydrolyzing) [Pelagibacterales bacterium]|nr:asparagine synthase (glutamine-hydrolyzing) [Pelagibacterales bacterium]|tara:strand:- start:12995 stop:14788 length:1794 start_codon:yes stop_codon:yes gene_type:complete